jgi:hypothetical protein
VKTIEDTGDRVAIATSASVGDWSFCFRAVEGTVVYRPVGAIPTVMTTADQASWRLDVYYAAAAAIDDDERLVREALLRASAAVTAARIADD